MDTHTYKYKRSHTHTRTHRPSWARRPLCTPSTPRPLQCMSCTVSLIQVSKLIQNRRREWPIRTLVHKRHAHICTHTFTQTDTHTHAHTHTHTYADTRDWTDGLLSNIFREINKPLPPDRDEARCVHVFVYIVHLNGARSRVCLCCAFVWCMLLPLPCVPLMLLLLLFFGVKSAHKHTHTIIHAHKRTQVSDLRWRCGCGLGGEHEQCDG